MAQHSISSIKTFIIIHACPSSHELPNDLSRIIGLHTTICIKEDMVVELCVGNYAMCMMALLMELMVYSNHQHLIITKP
jgi:hypothetical protein